MRPSTGGVQSRSISFRVSRGNFTAIGRKIGTWIHRKYALTFSICCVVSWANRFVGRDCFPAFGSQACARWTLALKYRTSPATPPATAMSQPAG